MDGLICTVIDREEGISMTWIVNETITQESLAEKFATLMHQRDILQIPGAHDAMAGLMAQKTGFQALYLSGGAFTASKGLPDLGMITSEEVAERAKEIIRATNLPMLVDIDTGFGKFVARMISFARSATSSDEIIRATNLPMLVDIDTGFGGVLNVARTAVEMKEAKVAAVQIEDQDRKSTRLNSSHVSISYAVFCLKKKKNTRERVSH